MRFDEFSQRAEVIASKEHVPRLGLLCADVGHGLAASLLASEPGQLDPICALDELSDRVTASDYMRGALHALGAVATAFATSQSRILHGGTDTEGVDGLCSPVGYKLSVLDVNGAEEAMRSFAAGLEKDLKNERSSAAYDRGSLDAVNELRMGFVSQVNELPYQVAELVPPDTTESRLERLRLLLAVTGPCRPSHVANYLQEDINDVLQMIGELKGSHVIVQERSLPFTDVADAPVSLTTEERIAALGDLLRASDAKSAAA